MIGDGCVFDFLWLVLIESGEKLRKLSIIDQVLGILGQLLEIEV